MTSKSEQRRLEIMGKDDVLTRLEKLEADATKSPWRYEDNGFDGCIVGPLGGTIFGGEPHEGRIEPDDIDAELSIELRNNAKALLKIARAAQEHVIADFCASRMWTPTELALKEALGELK